MSIRGMTLIETLIYMAIFSLLMTSFVTSIAALQATIDTVHARVTALRNERVILDSLAAIVTNSDSIRNPASNGMSTTLSVLREGIDTTVTHATSTLIEDSGGTRTVLSEPDSNVNTISFTRTGDHQKERIVVSLTLQTYANNRVAYATSTRVIYLSP